MIDWDAVFEAQPMPGPRQHGTYSGAQTCTDGEDGFVRCVECRAAISQYARNYRAKQRRVKLAAKYERVADDILADAHNYSSIRDMLIEAVARGRQPL